MTEIRLGSINGSHGIKGWVKVFSHTDPKEAIFEYRNWTLRKGASEKAVSIEQGQVNGKRLIARLEGVDTRDLADELIGYEIHIDREQLPALESGEFYWYQLEGLRVRNEKGDKFGVVDHMLETGANDVLVVKAVEDSVDQEQRLIPCVMGDIVKQVDLEIGEIVIDWEVDY